MEINTDFGQRVVMATADMDWVASPLPGVMRRMLERDGEDGSRRATSVVRYAPGSQFSAHVHARGEEFLVLDGTFSDERDDFPKGTYVRNPPGSSHAPYSSGGTTIFVKLQQFQPGDTESVVVDTGARPWQPGEVEGESIMPLHAFASERVSLVRLGPGTRLGPRAHGGGEEVFVIAGAFADEHGAYAQGTWLRAPPGASSSPFSEPGATHYVKRGHLG